MAVYEKEILSFMEVHRGEIFADLLELVKAQSPTANRELVNQCAETIRGLMRRRLGLEGETISQPEYGDHLLFTYGSQPEQVLLVGHYDTVWDKDQIPLVEKDGRIHGPGIFDMKAGLLAHIWAVKACKELGIPLSKRIRFLFNGDEETGSHTSRATIEAEAKKSVAAIITEPTEQVTGNIKAARKGVRFYAIEITGKAAHAGNDPLGGVSAIEEAAHQVILIHSLTDHRVGTTLNVGVIQGGAHPNVIADHVRLEVDLRTRTMKEAERIHQIISNLQPVDKRCTLVVDCSDPGRPPLEDTPANQKLFAIAHGCAARLGFELGKTEVGGGSDGNFTSAVGCPTLDGMGAMGDGPHAVRENIEKEKYLPRIALLAGVLSQL